MSVVHGSRKKLTADSIREGSVVRIKSKEWYDKNKDGNGKVWFWCGRDMFVSDIQPFLGKDVTVTVFDTREKSKFKIIGSNYWFTPEMVEYVVKY